MFLTKKTPNKNQFCKLPKTTSLECLNEFFQTTEQLISKTLFLSFIRPSCSSERRVTNWYNVVFKVHQRLNWFERTFKLQLCLTCIQNIVVQSLKWWKAMALSLMDTTQPIRLSKQSKSQVAMLMKPKNIFRNNEISVSLCVMTKLLKTFVLTTTKRSSYRATTLQLKTFLRLQIQSIYCLKVRQ